MILPEALQQRRTIILRSTDELDMDGFWNGRMQVGIGRRPYFANSGEIGAATS